MNDILLTWGDRVRWISTLWKKNLGFYTSSLYEWNIDRMSEYNILNTLQQMTMVANAYKTQIDTPEKNNCWTLYYWFF